MSNKIGRFEILSELAHSDRSVVYKATDTEDSQTVALKAVRVETLGENSADLVKAVLEEAEAAKVLNSHNIAALKSASEADGHICGSMEYVQGNAIATMLARKEGFSIWDLQDIARQACQGLDHAHVKKVFHYSLEPAKIMVQWDGIVKILSFGMSKLAARHANASGPAADVLHYMSPEQLRGETVDARSNIFSLGAILYEMVTERKAFDGDDADQVRQAIQESSPTPVDQVNRKIHPALSAVIMKALCKSPDERYQSGQDLVNDLERCKENPAKATVGSKPAAAVAPKIAKPAAPKVAPPAKAAAAAAGAEQFTVAPAKGFSQEQANMSTVAMEEPEVKAPKINVDPMMDEGEKGGAKGPSFSEISELPPLKEVYVAPGPAASEEEQAPQSVSQASPATIHKTAPEKPKVQPREVAKKAVTEIKKTPPHMFVYSIAGAAAVILLVVAGIAYHIHSGDSDDDSVAQPAPTAAAQQPAPAPAPAAAAQPATTTAASTPTEITPAPPIEEAPAVSVTPKVDNKAHGKKKGKAIPTAPAIVAGQLEVDSTPAGAQIQVDGQSMGITPFNLAQLNPGQHTVAISKPGFAPETRTVNVASGSHSMISVQLSSLTATLAANSNPAGASVWIDGKDSGKITPAQIAIDKAGAHTLTFKKQGYLDESASVNLQIGQTTHVSPELRALGQTDEIRIGGGKFKKIFGGSDTAGMGSVSVKTQPKGAQVAVNNRIVDKMSPVDFYLNPGNYVIDITASGFKAVHKVVTVEKNGKVVIEESLDRE